MNTTCNHRLLDANERKKINRRSNVLSGCIQGSWTNETNTRIEAPLAFMLGYLREILSHCVSKLSQYAEVSSVQTCFVSLMDANGETFLEDKSKVEAFVQQRNPQPIFKSSSKRTVEREVCEDAVQYPIDSETFWQSLNINKNVFYDESVKQLLQNVGKMKMRLGYLERPVELHERGPLLIRSLADGYIYLTEQYGPGIKVILALLNSWFHEDHLRCVHCSQRWSTEVHQLATKCSGWDDMYTHILNSRNLPDEIKQMARVFLNDIHPNDFCVLLMSMGRASIVEKWSEVTATFAKIKRTGNGGVNMVLLMIAINVLEVSTVPFYLIENSLQPTTAGVYKTLVEKWPPTSSLKPQHVWVCAQAYNAMMKSICNTVTSKLKDQPNSMIVYSTNTPVRKKVTGKNAEKMVETFGVHLKNITGRSEYTRVCLADTGHKTLSELFAFVTSAAQSYYDLFVFEPKKENLSGSSCTTPSSVQ